MNISLASLYAFLAYRLWDVIGLHGMVPRICRRVFTPMSYWSDFLLWRVIYLLIPGQFGFTEMNNPASRNASLAMLIYAFLRSKLYCPTP